MEDSIYRLRQRDILMICVLALLALGVIMVQSASMSVAGHTDWRWTPRATRHLIYALVAIATFFAVGLFPYRALLRTSGPLWRHPIALLFGFAVFACTIVLVPGIGIAVNGARRWLPLGPVQVQPSELGKWSLVVFLAWWLTRPEFQINRFFRGLMLTFVPIGIVCLLVVIHDFGTSALIGLCAVTILLAGGARLRHLMLIIPPALLAAFWFVYHQPYRWRRMTAFLDPYASPQGDGYHMIQSLLSFSTGGITGRGLGNGVQKLGYLPEDTTDFIFAVICEELGLFGALLTIALYAGILYVAWQAIRQLSEPFARLLVFGLASMLGLQAVINIAVATVSVPTKGLPLPLVSAGGSGLVITCAALGLMYSVLRDQTQTSPEIPDESYNQLKQQFPVSTNLG